VKKQNVELPVDDVAPGLVIDNDPVKQDIAVAQSADTDPLLDPFAKDETPTLLEAVTASALMVNSVSNIAGAISKQAGEDPTIDPNFNPYAFALEKKADPRVAKVMDFLAQDDGERLNRIQNEGEFWRLVDGLNTELRDVETAASWGIVPMLAGGAAGVIADPTTWLGAEAGAPIVNAIRAAKLIKGARALGAARGAIAGFAEGVGSELSQEANRELHTAEDALIGLGTSTALGGALGALLLDATGSVFKTARKASDLPDHPMSSASGVDEIEVPLDVDAAEAMRQHRSLSAAAVDKNGVAKGGQLGYLFDKWTPVGRAIRRNGNDDVDLSIFNKLMEIPVKTLHNEGGIATAPSAELLSRHLYDTLYYVRQGELSTIYNEMSMKVFGEGALARNAKNLAGSLINQSDRVTPEEFFTAVTNYRRAQAVVEEAGEGVPAEVAKRVVEQPHPNAQVSEYIKRAAEVENRYYGAYADYLEKHGLLDAGERRKFYVPQVYNREAIVQNRSEFADLLRDNFKANPPSDWLQENYGVRSIREMEQAQRQEALDDWVVFQRGEFERAAEEGLKKAQEELKQTLDQIKGIRRAARTTERNYLRTLYDEARTQERELLTRREELSLSAAQRRAEIEALEQARRASAARQQAAEITPPRKAPDVGARELSDLDRLKRSFEGGKASADDVFAAEQRAKVEPLPEASTAPEPIRTNMVAVTEERLRKANVELRRIDRELADTRAKLDDVSGKRIKLEASLKTLSDTRKAAARALRMAAKAKTKAERKVAKADKKAKAAATTEFKTVEDRIDEIVDNLIRGKTVPQGILKEIGESGRLKDRNIDWGEMIFDPRLQKFLHNDAETIANRYGRDISPRVALRMAFGNDVDDSLTSVKRELRQRWQDRIDAAPPAQREVLSAQMKEAMDDFTALVERLHGRYGLPEDPSSALMWMNRNVRKYNVARLMGLALLSSFTDVATGVLATNRAFAWVPYMGRRVMKIAQKMPDHELRALLVATDQARHSATINRRMFAEVDNLVESGGFGTGRVRQATRAIDKATDVASTATMTLSGLGGWTARMKFIFGAIQIENMTRELGKWGSLSAKQRANWARLGIDEAMASRIAKQLAKHAEDVDGVRLPNGKEWTDSEAYTRFQLALQRSLDEAVVTPGLGDTPLFMSRPAGQLLLQFMSFAFASVNRFSRLAWQRRDLHALLSVNMSLALGALGYAVREVVKGTDDKGRTAADRMAAKTSADWMLEAFTRSPLPGALSYGVDTVRKLGSPLINDIAGTTVITPPSRLAERGVVTGLMGPTVGMAEQLVDLGVAIRDSRDKGMEPVINKAQKLQVWQNLLPLMLLSRAAAGAYGGDIEAR
jgi:hypothetical protein